MALAECAPGLVIRCACPTATWTSPHKPTPFTPPPPPHYPLPLQRNTEFGYSRKDVVLIGVALTGGGYALYYGLQAGGMEAGYAGNWVQVCLCVGGRGAGGWGRRGCNGEGR